MITWLLCFMPALYLIMTGVVYAFTEEFLSNKTAYDPQGPATVAGVFWPIALPVFLGVYLARTPARIQNAAQERAATVREIVRKSDERTRELERTQLRDPWDPNYGQAPGVVKD